MKSVPTTFAICKHPVLLLIDFLKGLSGKLEHWGRKPKWQKCECTSPALAPSQACCCGRLCVFKEAEFNSVVYLHRVIFLSLFSGVTASLNTAYLRCSQVHFREWTFGATLGWAKVQHCFQLFYSVYIQTRIFHFVLKIYVFLKICLCVDRPLKIYNSCYLKALSSLSPPAG